MNILSVSRAAGLNFLGFWTKIRIKMMRTYLPLQFYFSFKDKSLTPF